MKKPISVFALAVWAFAALCALLTVPELIALFKQPSAPTLTASSAKLLQSFWPREVFVMLRSTVSSTGLLFAAGVIIEQIDSIRWHAAKSQEAASAV